MFDNLNPIFNDTTVDRVKKKPIAQIHSPTPTKTKRAPRKDKGHSCKFPVTLEQQIKYKTSLKRFKYHFPNIEIHQTKYNTLLLQYALENPQIVNWNLDYPGTSEYHMTTKLPEYKFNDIGGEYGIAINRGLSLRKTVFIMTSSSLQYIEKGGYYNGSYSKLELLKNKIQEESKSLWQTLMEPNYRYIEIKIPYFDYLRGNVLIADIKEVVEDCPANLNLVSLISLLYVQFLMQVKKGVTTVNNRKQGLDLLTISHKLLNLKESIYGTKLVEKIKIEQFNQLTPNTWGLEEYEEEVERNVSNKEKYAYLTIRMKTEQIYRGEILIHDLSIVNDEFDLTVEEILALLYIDFISKIKSEGNNDKVLKSIVSAYDYYRT